MYTHFNIKPAIDYALVTPGTWVNLSRELKTTVNRFISYHRTTPSAVQSDHLLVKIITLMGVPYSLSPERFYYNVLNSYKPVCEALGMGTDRNSPKFRIHKSSKMYRNSEIEIGIACDSVIDPDNACVNWRNISPLRILCHSSSDISPKLLLNADYAQPTPYVIYEINVPLLMLQFKAWRENELTQPAGSRKTLLQFVKMYPITNAVHSHVDLALIESIYRTYLHEDISITNSQDLTDTGNSIVNSSKLLVDYANKSKENFSRVPMSYDSIMANLITMSGNAWNSFSLPALTPMSQTCWPLSLAALRYWNILSAICGRNIQRLNRSRVNSIKREYRMFATEEMWKRELPESVFNAVMIEKNKLFSRF
jgi:hypothetical protein